MRIKIYIPEEARRLYAGMTQLVGLLPLPWIKCWIIPGLPTRKEMIDLLLFCDRTNTVAVRNQYTWIWLRSRTYTMLVDKINHKFQIKQHIAFHWVSVLTPNNRGRLCNSINSKFLLTVSKNKRLNDDISEVFAFVQAYLSNEKHISDNRMFTFHLKVTEWTITGLYFKILNSTYHWYTHSMHIKIKRNCIIEHIDPVLHEWCCKHVGCRIKIMSWRRSETRPRFDVVPPLCGWGIVFRLFENVL